MKATGVVSTRSPFESDNSKNLEGEELASTFVQVPSFWRLVEGKHHIVLGSRGSGKTALLKMLAHQNLCRMEDERARQLIGSKELVGIYVPLPLSWTSALLAKPWGEQSRDAERYFQWQFNLHLCDAFLVSIASCLREYYPDRETRYVLENRIARELSRLLYGKSHKASDLASLRRLFRESHADAEREIQEARSAGGVVPSEPSASAPFSQEVAQLASAMVPVVSDLLRMRDYTRWAICVDEVEYLPETQQRILNTLIRTAPGTPRINFKFTATPYGHITRDTNLGDGVSVSPGHDFEYIYIDHDSVLYQGDIEFADHVFRKRLKLMGADAPHVGLVEVFGASPLSDEKPSEWEKGAREWMLLERYADDTTISRAKRLSRENARLFRDQISRKMHGALLLRDAVAHRKGGQGTLQLFGGAKTIVKCADGNPRRLIRILNRFFLRCRKDLMHGKQIPIGRQEEVLREFAETTLHSCHGEPRVGAELHRMLICLGKTIRAHLYERRITSDQLGGIRISDSFKDDEMAVIKAAVNLGLLYPRRNLRNPDLIPSKAGRYQIANVFGPLFDIWPRREKVIAIQTLEQLCSNIARTQVVDPQSRLDLDA